MVTDGDRSSEVENEIAAGERVLAHYQEHSMNPGYSFPGSQWRALARPGALAGGD
jgi:hypothetical protein